MTTIGLARTARLIVLASCVPTIIPEAVAADHRVPWTGSKIAGTPDPPPPYTVEPAFPHLKFEFPVVLVRAEGTGRLFLGELRGRIYSFPERSRLQEGRPRARARQAPSRPDAPSTV